MLLRLARRRKFLLVGLLAVVFFSAHATAAQENSSWKQDLLTWRTQHAAELQKPDGWLALAGLVWLEPGDNSVGSAADNKVRLPEGGPAHVGVLQLEGLTVSLRPPADGGFPAGLAVDGKQ